jgi:hypothetical protein
MPGSYPDPRSYATTALQALEEAYEQSQDSHTGSLILTAIQAISHLTEEIKSTRRFDVSDSDPYELSEYNSAV